MSPYLSTHSLIHSDVYRTTAKTISELLFIQASIIKMTVFWDAAPCSLLEVYRRFRGACCAIALMMETANTSETPVSFYQATRRNILEDSHLHTRHRENLKSHQAL
jgi:hypothetical protein